MPTPYRLVSLLFGMKGIEGHFYSYNLALGAAARSLQWHHQAAVLTSCQHIDMPTGWHACLHLSTPTPQSHRSPFTRLIETMRLTNSLVHYLRTTVAAHPEPAILFMEAVSPMVLIALCMAIIIVPHHYSLWLLYRFTTHWDDWFRLFHRLMARLIAPHGTLLLLTDGVALGETLSAHFGQTVHTLPTLSYTNTHHDVAAHMPMALPPLCHNRVVCWWVGPPRDSKGWEDIRALTRLTTSAAQQLCVVAAHNAAFAHQTNGCHIHLIDNALSRTDYLRWFATSTVILLPYDPVDYAQKTSGIFIEAVLFGKIPVVRDGSWLAHELRTYGLHELILSSWGTDALADELLAVVEMAHHPPPIDSATNASLCQRLATMRADYQRNNGVDAYARAFQHLVTHYHKPL